MLQRTKLRVLAVAAVIFWVGTVAIQAADNRPANNGVANFATALSNEQAIKQALTEQTSVDVQGAPLSEVLSEIAEKHHLQFMFDANGLKDAGIDPASARVTFSVNNVSLRAALDMILGRYGLSWVIKNEVLLVTTKAKADSMFETRLYDVHDLVLHDRDPGEAPEFDSLIDAMRVTVNPQSWDKAGGEGSVAPFSNNGVCALIVWQNSRGHDEIENLLNELRSIKPQRVFNK